MSAWSNNEAGNYYRGKRGGHGAEEEEEVGGEWDGTEVKDRVNRGRKGRRWVMKWIDRKTGRGGASAHTVDKWGRLAMGSGCHMLRPLLCQGKASSLHSQHAVLPVSCSIPPREEACASQGYPLTRQMEGCTRTSIKCTTQTHPFSTASSFTYSYAHEL